MNLAETNAQIIKVADATPLDLTMLRCAYAVAKQSGDRSTKNGAVLTDGGNRILSTGYNDIPKPILDTEERRTQRPLKYEVIHHAEDHAIFQAAQAGERTLLTTLYTPWYACNKCAIAIISAGVKRVVGHADFFNRNPRWDLTLAFQMLGEAEVECDLIQGRLGVEAFVNGETVLI